jgi:acetyltransferase
MIPAPDYLEETRRRPLGPFFAPRSVAVIGATERPGTVGRALLENLADFGGPVYPVNPQHATVLGRPAFRSLAAVPPPVDLAVIATPAATVPGVVRDCTACGVKHAIILSAGFKETGPAGLALEAGIRAEALRGGLRLLGPNCLGLMAPHAGLNATFAAGHALPGSIAFLSQSGALCTAILGWSRRHNVGFSAFVSVGSMLDVGWGDLIDHLADDPQTKSVLLYMESVGDARAFLSAAREAAFTKPVIVLKAGRTEAAACAAASHTGALTGSDEVLDAAFRRAGVLRVDTIGELFDLAEVVAKQPSPPGPRLAIVTNAGGPGALATDELVAAGGVPAPFGPETLRQLDIFLPPAWSHGNPVDVLGDADPGRYEKAVDQVLRDPRTDGVLVILTPQSMTQPLATAEAVGRVVRPGGGKPVLASWMGGPEVEEGRAALSRAGIPVFAYPDTAARAFGAMWRRTSALAALYEIPHAADDPGLNPAARGAVEAVLAPALAAGRTLLSEHEAKAALAAYGIPVVPTRLAANEDEAVALAAATGYPVVLKLHSHTITHKAEVGGVRLGLSDADAVRAAWRAIATSVQSARGAGHFLGVTVQRMVDPTGVELILGSSVDPQFGPVLVFGAGGRLVEVLRDRALGLPPLNATLARRLMEQPRIFAALTGGSGRASVDLAALESLLVRFSRLVLAHPRIREIDLNPLLASAAGLLALDARVVLHDPAVPDATLPRPAIRPYPDALVSPWTMRDGTAVTIRPIRPEDEPMMVEFHGTLSDTSVLRRYFVPYDLRERVAHERLARLCFVDYDRELALVAEYREPSTGARDLLGVARLIRTHGRNEATFALVIGDPWQGRGLGRRLLAGLLDHARAEALARVTGFVLAENDRMLALCRRLGFTVTPQPGDRVCRLEIVLA